MTAADCTSWQRLRTKISDLDPKEYAGLPTPVREAPLVLAPGHPYFDRLNGFCLDPDKNRRDDKNEVGIEVINSWHDWRNRQQVFVLREAGKITWGSLPMGPMQRAIRLMDCIGVAITMDIEAEERAIKLLGTMISPHLFNAYRMIGTFIETSKRSGVIYQFRRLAPTIAWSGATGDIRYLASLCLHPIAFYDGLPMGAMVPTDDVIAHLAMMRCDEHLFWRKSNQHDAFSPGSQL